MTNEDKQVLIEAARSAHLSCGSMLDAVQIAADERGLVITDDDKARVIIAVHELLHA